MFYLCVYIIITIFKTISMFMFFFFFFWGGVGLYSDQECVGMQLTGLLETSVCLLEVAETSMKDSSSLSLHWFPSFLKLIALRLAHVISVLTHCATAFAKLRVFGGF